MPSFDLRFITAPEDMPGCIISVDARTVRGDVAQGAGVVTQILNRSPASLRQRASGDDVHFAWWDAVAEGFPEAAIDGSAFGGVGGVIVPSGCALDMTTTTPFPAITAGEYTVVFVVDGVFTGATQSVVLVDSVLQVKLNDGTGHLAWVDAGAGGSGTGTINGPQLHVVRFGKAASFFSPTVDWRRNCLQLFANTYTPTDFGGGTTKIFGFPGLFDGTVGRMLFYNRRLTDLEVAWLECNLAPQFGLTAPVEAYVTPVVIPEVRDWDDPEGASHEDSIDSPSRINPSAGHAQRSVQVPLNGKASMSVLIEAIENAGAGNEPVLSTASGYVPWYAEWPFIGSAAEPPVFQDLTPAVVKLRFTQLGHYVFTLFRQGGGTVLVPIDVVPE